MNGLIAWLTGRLRRKNRAVARPRRPGFTIVELLVSIAVLSLALSTVALVFKVTTDTTTQAAAFAEANGWLRQFSQQLKQDLAGINPTESILVVRGRTFAAALNADGQVRNSERFYRVQTGNPNLVTDTSFNPETTPVLNPANITHSQYSDPRADLLMFITNRAVASTAPPGGTGIGLSPTTNELAALRGGGTFAPVLVAYGHAAVARPVDQGGGNWTVENSTSWRHISQRRHQGSGPFISALPLQEWRLARRQTILLNNTGAPDVAPFGIPNSWTRDSGTTGPALALNLSGTGPTGWAIAGDAIMFDLAAFLNTYGPATATVNPYLGPDNNAFANAAANDGWRSLLYANPGATDQSNPPLYIAAIVPNPPPALRTNTALQALPACAWFQVELLMPEDPRNSPQYFDPTPGDPTDGPNRFDPPRWASVGPPPPARPGDTGSTYVFVPDSPTARRELAKRSPRPPNPGGAERAWPEFGRFPDPNPPPVGWGGTADDWHFNNPAGAGLPEQRRLRTWPYGIRITVRVFDPRGRLSEPLVRSIVHRFE